MSTKPQVIDREEFEEFLASIVAFERVSATEVRGKEYVYDCPLPADDLTIRIFSSIDRRTGRSRRKGSDAIRCVIWSHRQDKPVGGEKRTHRITTWRKNLAPKIQDLYADWQQYNVVCDCGAHMAPREGKHGEFLGCTAYPRCRNTQPITS